MNNYTEPPFSELFSRVPSSLKYWGVRSDSVKLKFFSSRFFFLIFTFYYLLLSYAFQSANVNLSFGGTNE